MIVALSLIPVLLFLALLFLFDSFKLVVRKYLFLACLWGIAAALLSYFANTFLLNYIDYATYTRYVSPATEEILKALLLFYLISTKRIGFMIDAVIYGFAVGTGFALAENIYYLYSVNDSNLLVWIIRGFGTAIMHGGTTAIVALMLIGAKSREANYFINSILTLFLAYIVHALFNHFYLNPVVQTLGIIILLPVLFYLVFSHNEKQLQSWLEIEFSSEIELMKMINKGQFRQTRAGKFLVSLKERFAPEVIFDMYCFISLYLELSIKAKRNIMLKENGFATIKEPDIDIKLTELKQLRKQIGLTGELTLSPLIRMNYRDLWKLKTLQ
ncbi:MAG: PrsW family intramembrane metalloprotease [Prolixibacteraceae bacterium]|nr:PrsW family intramembrane metalloprotease [Prolixibacteraceae bacterium]